jgi:hypothetical protein
MKHIPTYNELTGTQKEVCDLCLTNQKAADNNTELCIAFWRDHEISEYLEDIYYIIRKYPPESLTKYRRNLVEWGLIFPSEESKKHSREMEAQNHKTPEQHNFENGQNQLFKSIIKSL